MKIHTEKKLESMQTVQNFFALFAGFGWFLIIISPLGLMYDYGKHGREFFLDDLSKLPQLIIFTCLCTVASLFMSKWRLQYDYDILEDKVKEMLKEEIERKKKLDDYIAEKRRLFKESGAWQDITLDEIRYGK